MAALPVLTLDAVAKRVKVAGVGDTYVLPADSTVIGTLADSNTDLATVAAHLAATTNPHSVTVAQLGAVPNASVGVPLGVATLTAAGELAEPVAGAGTAVVGAFLNSSGGWSLPPAIPGPQGASLDHTTRTAGNGAAGSTDTYTAWGDAAGTINLGTFTVYNGSNGVLTGPQQAFQNESTIKTDMSILAGNNAMSAGPLTIAEGINVTIADNANWTVI